MSSSSKHHHSHSNKSHSRTDYSSYNSSASSSSSRHPTHEQKRSSNSYWDTVLEPLSLKEPTRRPNASSASRFSNLDDRRRAIAKSTPRECPNCRRSFPSTHSFEGHVKTCSPFTEKPYACDTCGTAFKKNSNLVKHMKLVHLGERKFACQEPGCGRLFGQKSNLNSHVRAVHLGEKPFICTERHCNKRFSQKSGLKAHIKTVHNGERPYICDCGSSFGHRGDLNRHIRVLHQKQRPFECTICPDRKAFGRKSVLMRHMQTHASHGGHGMPHSFSTDSSNSS